MFYLYVIHPLYPFILTFLVFGLSTVFDFIEQFLKSILVFRTVFFSFFVEQFVLKALNPLNIPSSVKSLAMISQKS